MLKFLFQILRKYATDWIVQIDDITNFVKEQHQIYEKKGDSELQVAKERIFTGVCSATASRIKLDFSDEENAVTVIRGFTSTEVSEICHRQQVSHIT